MGSAVEAIGNKLFTNMVPTDKIEQKAREESDKAKSDIQEKIDLKTESVAEVSKLQTLVSKADSIASEVVDPINNLFRTKIATTSSEEIGLSAEDFLKNVRVEKSAVSGITRVAVASVAKESDLVISSGVADVGFANEGAVGLKGKLTLTLAGQNVEVDFVVGDSLEEIFGKVKESIVEGDHDFAAFILQGQNDTSFIEVRAKNTGAASSISFAYADSGGTESMDEQSLIAGSDAEVYVNSVKHEQASNKFVDIVPGTSFEVTRANTLIDEMNPVSYDNLNKSKISVAEDVSHFKKLVVDLANTLSELSHIVAKNKQGAYSIKDLGKLNPEADLRSLNAEDAPLRGSAILQEAEDLFNKFVSGSASETGEIKSLFDLGITIKERTEEGEGFSYEEFVFSDQEIFAKAFEDDFDKVYNFLVTNAKVTPEVGNVGYIQYIPSELANVITDSSVVNKDIALAVTYDDTGAVEKVTADVGGTIIEGNIKYSEISKRYSITFSGTETSKNILDGIYLSIDPNGAIGATENSIINYNPGLISEVISDLRNIYSKDGLEGSSIDEIAYFKELLEADEEELSEVDLEFKKMIEEIQGIEIFLQIMETQTNLLMSAIEAAIGD